VADRVASGHARVRQAWALATLAAILVITAAWWALALWPAGPTAAEWLLRTRLACFGSTPSGLPDAGGWLLLVGQPVGMLGVLLAVWGEPLAAGVGALRARWVGRVALTATGAALAIGIAAAGWRVAAAQAGAGSVTVEGAPPASVPRLDRPAPPLALLDQHGNTVGLERFRGRPVFVTFAYAHCETVCPIIVHDVLAVRRAATGSAAAVVIVTLDPWRDVPARLPAIARQWDLRDDELVVSGDVARVTATLDAWRVGWRRNPATGDVDHPALVYLVAPDGRIAFAATTGQAALAVLLARL